MNSLMAAMLISHDGDSLVTRMVKSTADMNLSHQTRKLETTKSREWNQLYNYCIQGFVHTAFISAFISDVNIRVKVRVAKQEKK